MSIPSILSKFTNLTAARSALTGAAIALSSTAIFTQPSYAESTTFRCVTRNGKPTTMVYISSNTGSQEEVPFLNWYRAFSSPRAKQLCEEVSEKLQSHSKNAQEIYLTTGQVEGKFVVCFAKTSNERCSSNSEKLFTLAPTDDPNLVLSKLPDSTVTDTLNESSGRTYGNVRLTFFGFPIQLW
jgi:hypothetical protein